MIVLTVETLILSVVFYFYIWVGKGILRYFKTIVFVHGVFMHCPKFKFEIGQIGTKFPLIWWGLSHKTVIIASLILLSLWLPKPKIVKSKLNISSKNWTDLMIFITSLDWATGLEGNKGFKHHVKDTEGDFRLLVPSQNSSHLERLYYLGVWSREKIGFSMSPFNKLPI